MYGCRAVSSNDTVLPSIVQPADSATPKQTFPQINTPKLQMLNHPAAQRPRTVTMTMPLMMLARQVRVFGLRFKVQHVAVFLNPKASTLNPIL